MLRLNLVQIAYDTARVEIIVATIYEAKHSYSKVISAYPGKGLSTSHMASGTHEEPFVSSIAVINACYDSSAPVVLVLTAHL